VNGPEESPKDPLSAARDQAMKARQRGGGRHQRLPETIGPYTIVARLGAGGAGVVYLAEDAQTGSPAAVKVLRPEFRSGSTARRFAQEIDILRTLDHPGIAQILRAGVAEVDGSERLYCAMEYIAGSQIIRHADLNQLPPEARLRLVLEVCDALAYAHARGVIHRDLKPHNILVEMGGHARILDFGVARWASKDRTTMHTEVGQILGTVQYMSPEQITARHDELDGRTDIYSLGVVLFELLTGDLPYEADHRDAIATMRAIRDGRPRLPRAVRPDLPEPCERLILHAMAIDPAARYPTADALARDIHAVLEGRPIEGVPEPPPARRTITGRLGRFFGRSTNDATRE
jgi:serine/threonine protein kinase